MVFQLKCFGMFTMGNAIFMFQTCLSAEKLWSSHSIFDPSAYKYSPVSAMDSASIDNNVIALCFFDEQENGFVLENMAK
uniref:Uncharacterized protein n=1 Tax=Quercus lobata TaxID=97700 RepID=A0A7N2M0N1_QUELO